MSFVINGAAAAMFAVAALTHHKTTDGIIYAALSCIFMQLFELARKGYR